MAKKRTVVKYTDESGGKVKSVERRSGKRTETYKAKGYKSKQKSKDGVISKTVTKTKDKYGRTKEKEVERRGKYKEVRKGKTNRKSAGGKSKWKKTYRESAPLATSPSSSVEKMGKAAGKVAPFIMRSSAINKLLKEIPKKPRI